VKEHNCDLGIAYDGDGDRCLAVDENGNEIDGDKILAIIAKYLKSKGKLNKDTVVATVMSNLGLNKYAKDNNLNFVQTKVGDRYVLEEMLKEGYNLGGEQSGHVICLDYNPTGDGILTSLMLIRAILESGKKTSEVASIMKAYPQVLINAKVSSDKKFDFEKDEEIKSEIEKLEQEFNGNGRVLIRASGTEPLVRVMIEGEDQNYIKQKAQNLANIIEKKLN
jgi:phosphoglucosamine mutase